MWFSIWSDRCLLKGTARWCGRKAMEVFSAYGGHVGWKFGRLERTLIDVALPWGFPRRALLESVGEAELSLDAVLSPGSGRGGC